MLLVAPVSGDEVVIDVSLLTPFSLVVSVVFSVSTTELSLELFEFVLPLESVPEASSLCVVTSLNCVVGKTGKQTSRSTFT